MRVRVQFGNPNLARPIGINGIYCFVSRVTDRPNGWQLRQFENLGCDVGSITDSQAAVLRANPFPNQEHGLDHYGTQITREGKVEHDVTNAAFGNSIQYLLPLGLDRGVGQCSDDFFGSNDECLRSRLDIEDVSVRH
jgi:hypothetical protein